jgi:hypothetical protein
MLGVVIAAPSMDVQRAMNQTAPGLVWVVVDGVACHVSTFAHLTPRQRPHARCPQCDRAVTLKLGTMRRHHAAHDAGDVCAATNPETALHLNCKFALAHALRMLAGHRAVLTVARRCAGVTTSACTEIWTGEWTRGWDEVMVEHVVGDSRRPDIVLRRNGATVAALEIVVSSEVSDEKARALAELGVPWVEVSADERIAAWTPIDPLPISRLSDEHDWRCDIHRALNAAAAAASAAARSTEREAARHASVLRAARVADIYHDGGARERRIYRVMELSTDGRAHAMRLQRGGLEIATVSFASDSDPRLAAWRQLRAAFIADVDRVAGREGSFADSPMRWARDVAAENIVGEAFTDRVGFDPTPLATRFPRRWFWDSARARWFLPSDMRDVRWDRAQDDVFAAHPAWSRAHLSVRERPAPEGSWPTPVFASRPAAAMFRDSVRSITPVAMTGVDGTIVLVELARPAAISRRVIAVIERPTVDEAIGLVASSLEADGVDAVWISHPSDWSKALTRVPWMPAGRDWRGRGGVVVDDVGVFRADQFARALVSEDRRLSATAIRQHMASRVERMLG